jgi:DNA polymerase I-like protein with 3'-5' exonuclease and polymerase domains
LGGRRTRSAAWIRAILQRAIDEDLWVIGWNLIFDIQWCIAYGCRDLVHQVKWLDGMLLWRHLHVEPEYEMDRSKKKAYKLKPDAVEHFIPIMAGYQDDVNFHSVDPVDLAKLQKYNDRDSVSAWVITKMIWQDLTEKQRACALIEAACLSLVAEANFRGMPVDTIYAHELAAKLEHDAAVQLEKLAPHGVTEKIVRSPMQLGKLLFDDWKLPVLKENTGKKTGKVSRATDQEVLHELAFVDPRAKELRAYREALNNKTKFADTPRSRPSTTATGCRGRRRSCSAPTPAA